MEEEEKMMMKKKKKTTVRSVPDGSDKDAIYYPLLRSTLAISLLSDSAAKCRPEGNHYKTKQTGFRSFFAF